MNTGKTFENDFKSSKPDGVWLYRLRDGSSAWDKTDSTRFQAKNVADFLFFHAGALKILELKSVKGPSIPFTDINYANLCEMVESSKIDGISSYVIINFRQETRGTPETYAVPAHLVKAFIDAGERKSIPVSYAREHGIKIEGQKKKVHYRYDLSPLM